MSTKVKQEAQNPLILRAHRLMEAFTKSDDERDFYLDRQEGFIIYTDLDKPDAEISLHENEVPIARHTWHAHRSLAETLLATTEKLLKDTQTKEGGPT